MTVDIELHNRSDDSPGEHSLQRSLTGRRKGPKNSPPSGRSGSDRSPALSRHASGISQEDYITGVEGRQRAALAYRDGDMQMPHGVPHHNSQLAFQISAMTPAQYVAFEKALLWKIDTRLIPWMTLLYLMSFLDRVNIGTARLVGLVTQLHLTSQQFSNASMVFFVTYVFFEVPSNLILRKVGPSRWLPATMVIWAVFQICMGLVTNYAQLIAIRLCLGIFEAGLFPGLNFYLTAWYRREELNKRAAVFFAGAVLSGAFGGILGFGFSRMNGVGGKEGWSWIFIMEGILTLIVAVISFKMVHDFPDTAKFLTPLEREFMIVRMRQEQGFATEGEWSLASVRKALVDIKTYWLMVMYIGACTPLYAVSLFLPSIVAALGKWSTSQSLLLAVPPWAFSFVATIATAWISDRYKRRAYPLMVWSLVGVVGYAMLLGLDIKHHAGVLYFAAFLIAGSVGPMVAGTISWTGNTFGNHYKKAVAMGLVFSCGNSGGIISSEVYRGKDAPNYRLGYAVTLAFCVLNFVMAFSLHLYLRYENKRRDREYGPPPARGEIKEWENPEQLRAWGLEGKSREEIVAMGDDHPAFRFII